MACTSEPCDRLKETNKGADHLRNQVHRWLGKSRYGMTFHKRHGKEAVGSTHRSALKSTIRDPTTPTLLLEGSLTDLDCFA